MRDGGCLTLCQSTVDERIDRLEVRLCRACPNPTTIRIVRTPREEQRTETTTNTKTRMAPYATETAKTYSLTQDKQVKRLRTFQPAHPIFSNGAGDHLDAGVNQQRCLHASDGCSPRTPSCFHVDAFPSPDPRKSEKGLISCRPFGCGQPITASGRKNKINKMRSDR